MDSQTMFNEVLSTLESCPFPANKTAVLNAARQSNVSNELLQAIERLPGTALFKSPQDLIYRLQSVTM